LFFHKLSELRHKLLKPVSLNNMF